MGQTGKRRETLDAIRGAALMSMIAYHACWDLVWIFRVDWPWYRSSGAYLWQQSICWTFILLSGFCFPFSRRPFRRGGAVFACGALITAATAIAMPSNLVFFGVLSFLGSAAFISAALRPLLRRIPAPAGIAANFFLFLMARHIDAGTLCFGRFRLPARLYQNHLTACFGFPPGGFFSTDYFPLLPWLFLFWTGYFLFQSGLQISAELAEKPPLPDTWARYMGEKTPPVRLLCAMGRRSLLIYLLHQPVIYGVLLLWDALKT